MQRARLRTVVLSMVTTALLGAPLTAWAATPSQPTVFSAGMRSTTGLEDLPGMGPRTQALIPHQARQVLVVSGTSRDADQSTVTLYQRGASGWHRSAGPWPAHNGKSGWTDNHQLGDLRSPYGVYGLTDAGGWLPNPGTRLSYNNSTLFQTDRTFSGKSMRNAFGYVVAINYNRKPGTSPLDSSRPLGTAKGGGIWLHVDSDAPTQGCISVSRDHMEELLRLLDPASHPVIAMGDRAGLAR